jgi:hypothetical protein
MALSEEFENVIVLGDEFYNEIRAHAISTDIEAVKVFAAAPAAMDLFIWLAYRCFIARCEERIPLFGDFGLTAQIGTGRVFATTISGGSRTMAGDYSCRLAGLPARICSDGRTLRVALATAVLPQTG